MMVMGSHWFLLKAWLKGEHTLVDVASGFRLSRQMIVFGGLQGDGCGLFRGLRGGRRREARACKDTLAGEGWVHFESGLVHYWGGWDGAYLSFDDAFFVLVLSGVVIYSYFFINAFVHVFILELLRICWGISFVKWEFVLQQSLWWIIQQLLQYHLFLLLWLHDTSSCTRCHITIIPMRGLHTDILGLFDLWILCNKIRILTIILLLLSFVSWRHSSRRCHVWPRRRRVQQLLKFLRGTTSTGQRGLTDG